MVCYVGGDEECMFFMRFVFVEELVCLEFCGKLLICICGKLKIVYIFVYMVSCNK